MDLLDREHAAVWPEIEAKLAERPHPQVPGSKGIEPHHLTAARHILLKDSMIEEVAGVTRGGGSLSVLTLRDRKRRETAFQRAAGRKRLLQARYLSWTQDTPHRPNMIGAAGERVVHASLCVAASDPAVGYRLVKPGGGQISTLLGHRVVGGPLDNTAYLTIFDGRGLPISAVTIVEVKNVRHWLYPSAAEIFQLVEKAVHLQTAHPDIAFVPVLVCRQAHYLTFTMAKDLGCFIFYTDIQPILPHSEVQPKALAAVRDGLGYNLLQTDSAHDGLVRAFKVILPKYAWNAAQQWRQTAPILRGILPTIQQLRLPSLSPTARNTMMDTLKRVAITELGASGAWVQGTGRPSIPQEDDLPI